MVPRNSIISIQNKIWCIIVGGCLLNFGPVVGSDSYYIRPPVIAVDPRTNKKQEFWSGMDILVVEKGHVPHR